MKLNIPVREYPAVYWPKELVDAGLTGEFEVYQDGITIVLVKPATPLAKIKDSLRLLVKTLELKDSPNGK